MHVLSDCVSVHDDACASAGVLVYLCVCVCVCARWGGVGGAFLGVGGLGVPGGWVGVR